MSQLEEVLMMAHATSGSKPPKSRRNEHKRWTPQEVRRLRGLARGNTPARVTGLKLGRSEHAVQSKASEIRLSLAPWNRSPYGKAVRLPRRAHVRTAPCWQGFFDGHAELVGAAMCLACLCGAVALGHSRAVSGLQRPYSTVVAARGDPHRVRICCREPIWLL